jgi:hypothetical protein
MSRITPTQAVASDIVALIEREKNRRSAQRRTGSGRMDSLTATGKLTAVCATPVIYAGAGGIFACPAIIAWQSYSWLRLGYWPALTVDDAWIWAGMYAPPQTGWLGIDKIIGWIFESPLSLSAFIGGVALLWAGIFFAGLPELISDHRRKRISN